MGRAGSCFSGIGAPEIGMPQYDWVFHAEVEPFPCAVLAERFPGSVNLGDVLAADFIDRAKAFGPLDMMAGGPPCQAFSVAGLRNSMADPRGNLSLRWVQILHAIRPRNAITENVPGWLSTDDNAFGCFLAGLVGADTPLCSPLERGRWPGSGMVAGPLGRAAWRSFDAQYFGLAQRRERVFVVADFGEGADPAEILFERKGLCGNPPPRGEKGQGIAADLAPSLTASGRGVERTGESRGQDPVVAETVGTMVHQAHGGVDTQSALNGYILPVAHPLRAEGFDASEDGTGRGTPLVPVAFAHQQGGNKDLHMSEDMGLTVQKSQVQAVCFTAKDHGADASDISPTLRSGSHSGSHANGGVMPAVAFDLRGRVGGAQFEGPHETANIRAANGGSSRSYVAEQWAVRRLTPTECHRLQGYPDDWCRVTYRNKPAADGPIYKALGNSWAVIVGRWIGARIHSAQAALREAA